MLFTDKDLLKALGLELLDNIKLENTNYRIHDNQHGIVLIPYEGKFNHCLSVKDLLNIEFEKLEQKIWTKDTISIGNIYYCVAYDCDGVYIAQSIFNCDKIDNVTLNNSILFTKQEYAKEYLKELKNFNQEYKEKIQHD